MKKNIVRENKFYAEVNHPWNVVYIARKANKDYAHSIDEVCDKYRENLISVQQVPGVFAKIMGEHGILARTETMAQLREIAAFAQAKQ